MAYFDATNTEHLALLPEAMRSSLDLEGVAAEAEADVLRYFTRRGDGGSDETSLEVGTDSDLRIYLLGYTADPASVDDTTYPNFTSDFRRSVAQVIAWRLQQRTKETGVLTEANPNGKLRTYRVDIDEPFPPAWDRWLQMYDSQSVSDAIVWGW